MVEDRFFGRYEHTLDGKGRLILPSRFRAAFEEGAFLSRHNEGCLALWTKSVFGTRMEEILTEAPRGRRNRDEARILAMTSQDVEIDKQGRLAIPAHLREFGALSGEVLVHGSIDHIEIWNPERWAQEELLYTSTVEEEPMVPMGAQ